jgi:hypothetical protein
MANLDAPLIPALTSLAGNEQLVTVRGNEERGLKVNGVLGLLPGDVTTVSGTTATISTRLTHCTSASAVTLTLPAASGNLRQVFILDTGANGITVNAAGSDVIVSATATDTSIAIATVKAAQLLSDGTKWYHVSNDA